MQRHVVATIVAGMLIALGVGSSNFAQAAAPAPASYMGVEQTISSIRDNWSRPGAVADPNAPGWKVFFDALLNDLRTYSHANRCEDHSAGRQKKPSSRVRWDPQRLPAATSCHG